MNASNSSSVTSVCPWKSIFPPSTHPSPRMKNSTSHVSGRHIHMRTWYIGATFSAILSAKRTPMIFAAISPKRSITRNAPIYTIVVAIWSESPNTLMTSGVIYFSAINVGALVTRSVPMRFVTRSFSFCFLIRMSERAPNRLCLIHPVSLCWLTDMSGISVLAKNARARTSERNNNMGKGSKGRELKIKFFRV